MRPGWEVEKPVVPAVDDGLIEDKGATGGELAGEIGVFLEAPHAEAKIDSRSEAWRVR